MEVNYYMLAKVNPLQISCRGLTINKDWVAICKRCGKKSLFLERCRDLNSYLTVDIQCLFLELFSALMA